MHVATHLLDWRDGQPYSIKFQDVYFSTDTENPLQGLQETQHVFLQHNQLATRWEALSSKAFTIVETGFGTGLNFLCAAQLWLDKAPPQACLHFVSFEQYPLSHADVAMAHQLWPSLAPISASLLAQYVGLTAGYHRIALFNQRVILTLIIGDVNATLPHFSGMADAWFLDGFSPSKNPDMWQPALFMQMARHSHAGTTFATFTSAGFVRRGLSEVGFEVHKAAGFGRKREMSYGRFLKGVPSSECTQHMQQPSALTATVIGAGIAGCATAYSLATKGYQVRLIERHADIAQEASGNPKGILYPRLMPQNTVQDQLALSGYLYTLHLLKLLNLPSDSLQLCGLLQLAWNEKELARIKQIARRQLSWVNDVNPETATALAGVNIIYPALHYPDAGWVSPYAFCSALIQHPNIQVIRHCTAISLAQHENLQWTVMADTISLSESSVVVLANANDVRQFSQTYHLPITAVRGQMSVIAQTKASSPLKKVLCSDGYATPAENGQHCIGATFHSDDTQVDIRDQDNLCNLEMFRGLSPDFKEANTMFARAALRCSTPDYLPLLGELIDAEKLIKQPPKHMTGPLNVAKHQGLFVNIGHGSKGLTTAPFCAEILANLIAKTPPPSDEQMLISLNPNRYLLREQGLKRLIPRLTYGTLTT